MFQHVGLNKKIFFGQLDSSRKKGIKITFSAQIDLTIIFLFRQYIFRYIFSYIFYLMPVGNLQEN